MTWVFRRSVEHESKVEIIPFVRGHPKVEIIPFVRGHPKVEITRFLRGHPKVDIFFKSATLERRRVLTR